VALNWRPADAAKIFTRWTHFYHSPLADEMFSTYGLPNLDLVPETGYSAEAGFDLTVADAWTASATVFHSEVTDEILYSPYYQNVNSPDGTRRDGVELAAGWAREKMGSFGVRYTYTEAKFTEGAYAHRDLPLVPRHRLRVAGAWYVTDAWRVQGGWRLVGAQRCDFDFANVGGALARYHLFDLGVRYTPEIAWLKGFVFGFTVDNLLDARYADYAGYYGYRYVYPAAGRCYLFSVEYEF
jgi:outer membrane receptor protein involved in Fe transport